MLWMPLHNMCHTYSALEKCVKVFFTFFIFLFLYFHVPTCMQPVAEAPAHFLIISNFFTSCPLVIFANKEFSSDFGFIQVTFWMLPFSQATIALLQLHGCIVYTGYRDQNIPLEHRRQWMQRTNQNEWRQLGRDNRDEWGRVYLPAVIMGNMRSLQEHPQYEMSWLTAEICTWSSVCNRGNLNLWIHSIITTDSGFEDEEHKMAAPVHLYIIYCSAQKIIHSCTLSPLMRTLSVHDSVQTLTALGLGQWTILV